MVQQDPKLALQHQMTIIECLDHPDLIVKREVREILSSLKFGVSGLFTGFGALFVVLQTLELLFRITNAQNVTVIVEKMLEFLCMSKDDYTSTDLVGKVAELAEKYPSRSDCTLKNVCGLINQSQLH